MSVKSFFNQNYRIIFSFIAPAAFLIALTVFSVHVTNCPAVFLNITVIICGIALGWAAGILISPYDKEEKIQFGAITKAVSAFASGYLLAKIDPLVAKILDPAILASSLAMFRLMAFVASFLFGAIIAFVFRSYSLSTENKNTNEDTVTGDPKVTGETDDASEKVAGQ